jgi:hypothetical protein
MIHYRVYLLSADDRIRDAMDIHCGSDEQAKRAAAEAIGEYPAVEIWQERRLSGRFTAAELQQLSAGLVQPDMPTDWMPTI